MSTTILITVDGPSASGKSTLARRVAMDLGIEYLDTGAFYRTVALFLMEKGVEPKTAKEWHQFFQHFHFDRKRVEGAPHYFLNGKDVTEAIRTPLVTKFSSKYATYEPVREHVNKLLRKIAETGDFIVDGRDTGSVVFPEADCKFFVIASSEVRARRRYLELKEKGADITEEEVLEELNERDEQDSNRNIDPLMRPKNSVLIDSSDYDIDEMVQLIIKNVQKRSLSHKQGKPGPYFYRFVRWLLKGFFRFFYDFEVHGKEHLHGVKGATIVYANHISFYDPPIIGIIWPEELYFLGKSSLFRFPPFSSIIKALNALPIAKGAKDLSVFKIVRKLMAKGKHLLVFPEGARSETGELLPFNEGIASLMALSEVDYLVPVYHKGLQDIWPSNRKLPKLFGKIVVKIGVPLRSEPYRLMDKREGRQLLMQHLRERMEELANEP